MAFFRARNLDWLLGLLGASFGAAAVGGLLTARAVNTWYRPLRKPRGTPPDWVFGPVWTALYFQMAIAAWLVRRAMTKWPQRRSAGQLALVVWGVQLVLNVAWSGVFFAQRRLGGGAAVIAALWAAIAACLVLTARATRLGGALLLPYLAWVSYASYLNVGVWRLNRDR